MHPSLTHLPFSLSGDLRENVISNAHKGCGPLDLSGMTAVSKNDGVTLFRPLLPLEKVGCSLGLFLNFLSSEFDTNCFPARFRLQYLTTRIHMEFHISRIPRHIGTLEVNYATDYSRY